MHCLYCSWTGSRLEAELAVPKGLHGALVNDGYFASGAAWSPDESAVAYTAEVGQHRVCNASRGRKGREGSGHKHSAEGLEGGT